jgi:hypothetical protein
MLDRALTRASSRVDDIPSTPARDRSSRREFLTAR